MKKKIMLVIITLVMSITMLLGTTNVNAGYYDGNRKTTTIDYTNGDNVFIDVSYDCYYDWNKCDWVLKSEPNFSVKFYTLTHPLWWMQICWDDINSYAKSTDDGKSFILKTKGRLGIKSFYNFGLEPFWFLSERETYPIDIDNMSTLFGDSIHPKFKI